MQQTAFAPNPAATAALAYALAAHCRPGRCLALYGGLGAGKTAFCAALADALGAKGQASSPTFALLQAYVGDITLYHMDLYRLGDADEVMQAGLDEYFLGDGLCLIEWPQVAEELLPADAWRLTITPEGEGRRLVLQGELPLLPGWQPQ